MEEGKKIVPVYPTIKSDIAEDFNYSRGEMLVYKALYNSGLDPDEWAVLYSVPWVSAKEGHDKINHFESDFVILNRELGVLVLEIKTDIMVYEDDKFFSQYKEERKDPMKQAQKAVDEFFVYEVNRLSEGGYCPVTYAVWMTSMHDKEIADGFPADWSCHTLTADAFGDDLKKYGNIEDAICYPKSAQEIGQNALKSIKAMWRKIIPDGCDAKKRIRFDFKKLVAELVRNSHFVPSISRENDAFVRLTAEQIGVLDYLKNFRRLKVAGPGGTGKTLIAVEKAKRLEKTLQPKEKMLFLVFNTKFRDYLRGVFEENKKIEVQNIHYFRAEKRTKNWNPDALAEKYRHFIIDEAQDIEQKELETASAAAEKNGGVFYLFYDNGQFLYGNSGPLPEMLSEEDSVALSVNCRNTLCVSRTAGSVVNARPLVKGPPGEKPRFFICEDNERAVDRVCELVKYYTEEKQLNEEDIAILSIKSADCMSVLNAAEKKFRDPESKVRLMTIRQFKGLEAKAVILVDMTTDIFTENAVQTREEPLYDKRQTQFNLFYTGASRAQHFLDIVFVGDTREFAKTLPENTNKAESVGDADKSDPIGYIQSYMEVECVE